MKHIILVLFLTIIYNSYGQDIILKVNEESIKTKVLRISEEEITYKKYSNINGPEYTISTKSVYKIIFEDGSIDTFNKEAVLKNELIKNPKQAIERGNNVYIISADVTSKKGEEYFKQDMKGWGYWNVVDSKEAAHFIIVFNIENRGMSRYKAWVSFRTIDGQEFKVSPPVKRNVNIYNGYNAAKPLAKKIIEKYFKKEFK